VAYGRSVSDRGSARWLVYAIPVVIAAGAIVWALMIPTEECVFGSDNSECTDNTPMKAFVAVAGIALAFIVLGIITAIRRLRRRVATPRTSQGP
jgi:hypothetical protein